MERSTKYKWLVVLVLIGIVCVSCLQRLPPKCVENATFIDNTKLQEKFKKQIGRLDHLLYKLNETEKVAHIPLDAQSGVETSTTT